MTSSHPDNEADKSKDALILELSRMNYSAYIFLESIYRTSSLQAIPIPDTLAWQEKGKQITVDFKSYDKSTFYSNITKGGTFLIVSISPAYVAPSNSEQIFHIMYDYVLKHIETIGSRVSAIVGLEEYDSLRDILPFLEDFSKECQDILSRNFSKIRKERIEENIKLTWSLDLSKASVEIDKITLSLISKLVDLFQHRYR